MATVTEYYGISQEEWNNLAEETQNYLYQNISYREEKGVNIPLGDLSAVIRYQITNILKHKVDRPKSGYYHQIMTVMNRPISKRSYNNATKQTYPVLPPPAASSIATSIAPSTLSIGSLSLTQNLAKQNLIENTQNQKRVPLTNISVSAPNATQKHHTTHHKTISEIVLGKDNINFDKNYMKSLGKDHIQDQFDNITSNKTGDITMEIKNKEKSKNNKSVTPDDSHAPLMRSVTPIDNRRKMTNNNFDNFEIDIGDIDDLEYPLGVTAAKQRKLSKNKKIVSRRLGKTDQIPLMTTLGGDEKEKNTENRNKDSDNNRNEKNDNEKDHSDNHSTSGNGQNDNSGNNNNNNQNTGGNGNDGDDGDENPNGGDKNDGNKKEKSNKRGVDSDDEDEEEDNDDNGNTNDQQGQPTQNVSRNATRSPTIDLDGSDLGSANNDNDNNPESSVGSTISDRLPDPHTMPFDAWDKMNKLLRQAHKHQDEEKKTREELNELRARSEMRVPDISDPNISYSNSNSNSNSNDITRIMDKFDSTIEKIGDKFTQAVGDIKTMVSNNKVSDDQYVERTIKVDAIKSANRANLNSLLQNFNDNTNKFKGISVDEVGEFLFEMFELSKKLKTIDQPQTFILFRNTTTAKFIGYAKDAWKNINESEITNFDLFMEWFKKTFPIEQCYKKWHDKIRVWEPQDDNILVTWDAIIEQYNQLVTKYDTLGLFANTVDKQRYQMDNLQLRQFMYDGLCKSKKGQRISSLKTYVLDHPEKNVPEMNLATFQATILDYLNKREKLDKQLHGSNQKRKTNKNLNYGKQVGVTQYTPSQKQSRRFGHSNPNSNPKSSYQHRQPNHRGGRKGYNRGGGYSGPRKGANKNDRTYGKGHYRNDKPKRRKGESDSDYTSRTWKPKRSCKNPSHKQYSSIDTPYNDVKRWVQNWDLEALFAWGQCRHCSYKGHHGNICKIIKGTPNLRWDLYQLYKRKRHQQKIERRGAGGYKGKPRRNRPKRHANIAQKEKQKRKSNINNNINNTASSNINPKSSTNDNTNANRQVNTLQLQNTNLASMQAVNDQSNSQHINMVQTTTQNENIAQAHAQASQSSSNINQGNLTVDQVLKQQRERERHRRLARNNTNDNGNQNTNA